ncbi:unnamed protein product [Phyllotreta striolata]|uniref:Uncharacterized protein n=1 Tax=Phyllotreta striolata TaxID=444603 RepID=A0A9P0DVE9_PHYSR|nr:unnamed protein product [Phyllotreta striolata]
MNTKKPYERGFELDMTSNTVNLDNFESFLGILPVFFRFQDYYVFKMNTKKDSEAVSSFCNLYGLLQVSQDTWIAEFFALIDSFTSRSMSLRFFTTVYDELDPF